MGQRHQIFVKIVNPVKAQYNTSSITAEMKKLCGNGEYAILPYHNQWLYGRSALQHALNLLIHASQFSKKDKVGEDGAHTSPFTKNGLSYNFSNFDKLVQAVGFIMNYNQKNTEFNNAGLSGSWYIGKEDYGIQNDFTRGDNNDGITIIDTIENKYCFMNISEWKNRDEGECMHNASDLPYLVPQSAHDYVNAYYGETIDYVNDYHVERATAKGKTISDVVAQHAKDNNKLVKQFKKFELLTVEDIIAMFPKMKKQMLEANKNMI